MFFGFFSSANLQVRAKSVWGDTLEVRARAKRSISRRQAARRVEREFRGEAAPPPVGGCWKLAPFQKPRDIDLAEALRAGDARNVCLSKFH